MARERPIRSGPSWRVGGPSQINMTDNEAAVSELADGTLALNSRNYLGSSATIVLAQKAPFAHLGA